MFQLAHQKNFNDEDLLNYLFKDKLFVLPIKYNYCMHFVDNANYEKFTKYFSRDISEFDKAVDESYIIHYSHRLIKPDFIINKSTSYLMKETGDFEKFMNLLKDYDSFSTIYQVNQNSQYGQRMKVLSNAFQKLKTLSEKANIFQKTFYKWFQYAYEILIKYDIKP